MRDPNALFCEGEFARRVLSRRPDDSPTCAGGQGRSPESIEASGRAFGWAALGLIACVVLALVLA